MPRMVLITPKNQDDVIADAAARLRSGGVVAFPTETVYGLGADTYDVNAIEQVYALKGRPSDNPLIAHVLDVEQARRVTRDWDGRCESLAERFWPGPLTLVMGKSSDVPDVATAGLGTVAVRCPNHEAARMLLESFGGPISAPSANRSGHVSPTTAAHVEAEFPEVEDLLVLDGGPCRIGIESTVVDMTGDRPRILRPGSVTADEIRDIVGDVDMPSIRVQTHSPGTSPAHYAPRTRTELVTWEQMRVRLATLTAPAVVLCIDETSVQAPHQAIEMPGIPEDYAHRLYGALREADAMPFDLILIETPHEDEGLWGAIQDRLRRASVRV